MTNAVEIPAVLRRRVLRVFGEPGQEWLAALPGIVDACLAKWHLTGCYASPVMSLNYLAFANSLDCGEIALKIGFPHRELYTEIESLTRFGGRGMCKLLDHDADLGAMLLERLRPGNDLTTIVSTPARTQIAAGLAASLPKPLTDPTTPPLPRVTDWTARAFARTRRDAIAGPKMLALVDAAERLLAELESPARPLVLLHGDLNHWNILQSGSDWKAIDPKGAIGIRCLEAGRFVINELDLTHPATWSAGLDTMTAIIGNAMAEPPSVIAACAFVDSVLSTCWSFAEHERRDLTAKVERCSFLLEGYLRLAERGEADHGQSDRVRRGCCLGGNLG